MEVFLGEFLKDRRVFQKPDETWNTVQAVLDWEIFMTPEQFKNTSWIEIKEFDRLIADARNQIKRDKRWKNVRIILYTWKKPTEFDNVFPWRDDIWKAYKDVIDTSIIPWAIYDNGIIIYMIPIDIQVANGTGTELWKISLD